MASENVTTGQPNGLEAAAQFFATLLTDEQLREQWAPLTSMTEVAALATSRGFAVNAVDVAQCWESMADPAYQLGDLTDDELSLVAGGASRGVSYCTGSQCTTCCTTTTVCNSCLCPASC